MKKIQHESTWDRDGLLCTLKVAIDASEVSRLLKKKYTSYQNNLSYKGFRKGKLTERLASVVFNDQSRMALAQELTESVVKQLGEAAIAGQSQEPSMTPEVECTPEWMKDGEHFSFVMRYECYPDVPEVSLDDITVPLVQCAIQDSDVDAVLEKLKASSVDWSDVDRPAGALDRVTVRYYSARVECDHDPAHEHGHEVEGTAAIELTEDLPASVRQRLLGVKAGDMLSIEDMADWLPYLQLHQHLHAPVAEPISLKVDSVSESKVVPFNEEIWGKLGYISAQSEDDLRAAIRVECEEMAVVWSEDYAYRDFKPKLLQHYDFPLPSHIVRREFERLSQEITDGVTDIQALAEQNVRLSLVLRSYAQRASSSVDQGRVEFYLRATAPMRGDYRMFFVRYVFQNEKVLRRAVSEVMERQLLDACLEGVKREHLELDYATLKQHLQGDQS